MSFSFIDSVQNLLAPYPPLLNVIFWMTLILALFTSTILLCVISLRLRLRYRNWRARRFKALWRPIIYAWLEDRQTSLPRLNSSDEVTMLELWLDVRDYVTGHSAARLNEFATVLKLDNIAAEVLAKPTILPFIRSVWMKMLAIRVAQAIQTPTAKQALIQASWSPSVMVAVAASAGLAQFDPAAAEPCILRTLIRFDRWAPFAALRISRAGGSHLLHVVGPHLQYLPPAKVRTLISLAELSDERSLVPLLRHRLKTTADNREKAMLLRALGRLGSQHERDVLLPLLEDEDWVLRVQAINALARLGSPADVQQLEPLLEDTQWWVRFRAAQAIWTLLQQNPDRLQRLMTTIQKPEARAVLKQVLTEQSVRT